MSSKSHSARVVPKWKVELVQALITISMPLWIWLALAILLKNRIFKRERGKTCT